MRSVVLDTNVLLQAVGRPRSLCARILQYLGELELCASADTIAEFEEVSARASVQRKLTWLTTARVAAIVDVLAAGRYVDSPAAVQVCRDPDDDQFIACALAAKADYLVTEDNDLLALNGYEGLRVVTPTEFLAAVGQTEDNPDGPDETPRGPS
jgi:putative PIN family toxin of toxin-antitoxin system